MSIELNGIVKRFGTFTAVDNVDLHIETGELLALVTLVLKYFVGRRGAARQHSPGHAP